MAPHQLERTLTTRDPLLVVILGPTGSGKTALSLQLAEHFHGEIVNCDSVAMYREFDIGTAKPSATERALAPHHLFDFVDPTEFMTAGEYARRARQVLQPVRWEEIVRSLLMEGVQRFFEIGPGRVLAGLLKRVDRKIDCVNVAA